MPKHLISYIEGARPNKIQQLSMEFSDETDSLDVRVVKLSSGHDDESGSV